MALLDMLQSAAIELRMPSTFTSAIGNTDAHVKLLLALANAEIKESRRDYPWPQLIKAGTITLSTGVSSYALPGDFDSFVADSEWNTSDTQPLIGPISAQDWNALAYGITGVTTLKQYRLEGIADSQFFIYPTPTAADSGTILAFRYKSSRCARPRMWASATTFNGSTTAPAYCFYNGNYYCTTVGGTTGATPPTHTSSTASDGGITWTYYDGDYSSFTADTDLVLFDQEMSKQGIKWRFQAAHNFDFSIARAAYDKAAKLAFARLAPSPKLRIDGSAGGFRLIDDQNIPDTI